MDPLHRAFHVIHSDPAHSTAEVLRALIESLDRGVSFEISRLYGLTYNDFALALEVLRAWRLDSYRYEAGWATRVAQGADCAAVPMEVVAESGREPPRTPAIVVHPEDARSRAAL